MIINANAQYKNAVRDILAHGSRVERDRTGTGTIKRFGKMFQHYPATVFPIVTAKEVKFDKAVGEMLWIYQDQSNDVNLLKEKYGIGIWNEWQKEDGTIGPAYGEQVRKFGLIDKLIDTLKNNPMDRGMVMSLWNEADLPDMALRPCAFLTMWNVDPATNELNLTLVQRSGDMGLGVPFNMVQYAVLQAMIAQVTNLEVGFFNHYIQDAHVYLNHVEPLEVMLSRGFKHDGQTTKPGRLWLNPEITNFYDFTMNDIKLEGYHSHPHIPMKVSV